VRHARISCWLNGSVKILEGPRGGGGDVEEAVDGREEVDGAGNDGVIQADLEWRGG